MEEVLLETETHKVAVWHDDTVDSPRLNENLGTMVCFHRRYNLGDEHVYDSGDYSGWEEMKKDIIKNERCPVIFPLYLYDHGGITISHKPFNCEWDSGQIGFIFASRKKCIENFRTKSMSKKIRVQIEQILLAEIEEYDQYITGETYGYTVYDKKGNVVGSCGGFYGDDFDKNGLLEYAKAEIDYK